MRKKGNYGVGKARQGKTEIASYSKKGNFNSAGTKRDGDTKYADYPDAPKHSMNPDYEGGTTSGDSGIIPS